METLEGKDALSFFKFSGEAKDVLQDLFTKYPPDNGETSEQVVGKHSKKVDKYRGKKDDVFCKPAMNKSEIAKRAESLASRIENTPNLRQVCTVSILELTNIIYHLDLGSLKHLTFVLCFQKRREQEKN